MKKLISLCAVIVFLAGSFLIVRMLGFETHSQAIGHFFLFGMAAMLGGIISFAYYDRNVYCIWSLLALGAVMVFLGLMFPIFLHVFDYPLMYVTEMEVNHVSTAYVLLGASMLWFGFLFEQHRVARPRKNTRRCTTS